MTEDESEDSDQSTATTPPEDEFESEPAPVTDQPTDETEDDSETDLEPSPALHDLHTTLEANGLVVELTDAETLTVERLGQTYRIHADGRIEGDGALHANLETLVDNAV